MAALTEEITQSTADGEMTYLEVRRGLKQVEEKTRVVTDTTAARVLHCRSEVHELERSLVQERVAIEVPVPMRIEYSSLKELIYCKPIPISDAEKAEDTQNEFDDSKDIKDSKLKLKLKLKKRKALPAGEVEEYLEFVEEGRMDGMDWDFGSFYPSLSQIEVFNAAVDERNAAIDEDREEEELERVEAEKVLLCRLLCRKYFLKFIYYLPFYLTNEE